MNNFGFNCICKEKQSEEKIFIMEILRILQALNLFPV